MNVEVNKYGNFELSFVSPINIDNGYINKFIGNFKSTFELFIHEVDIKKTTGSGIIEWIVYDSNNNLVECETIGVWFEKGKLIDYDGVFELPKQAKPLLNKYGISVSKEFYE